MEHDKLPHDHGQSADKVMENCPAAGDFQQVSELLRQLGDSSRVKLFWILCHCEECVINLSAMMDMSSPAISHHLRQLRSAGQLHAPTSRKSTPGKQNSLTPWAL